jgi:CheY-like chemotaxis protein
MNLLLVEDDPLVRRATARMLTRLGFEVELAECGDEAIAMLRTRSYDVVVSDYDFRSGPTGLDVLREAHRLRGAAYRVLFTGRTVAECRAGHADALVHRIFTKPATAADFRALYEAARDHVAEVRARAPQRSS